MEGSHNDLLKNDQEVLNPFPGLRPFSVDESHLFFGRKMQVDEITASLQRNRFIAVIGASGSGKSSLVYCGVIPALRNMKKTDENNPGWMLVQTRPGNTPLTNLAHDLISSMGIREVIPEPTELFGEDNGFLELIRKHADRKNLLIMIDQFEEIFRYGKVMGRSGIREDLVQYVNFLVRAVQQEAIPISLVITMRSDFIGECSRYQEFTKLINHSNYLVPRMTAGDFRESIRGPVKVAGASISPDLVNKLLDDLGDNPDQLPILQHVLMRTWDYWRKHNDFNKPIGISDYEAVGRMEKALSEHSNEAYDELDGNQKKVCESIFRTLTEKGGDNRGVRRPAKVRQLAEIAQANIPEVIKILDVFRLQGRSFLVPSDKVKLDEDSVIDISHESFMRIWDRLRTWVDEEASAVQMYKRLAQSAAQYQEGRTGLWRPPDLHLATNWKTKTNPTLAWAVRHDPAFERTMVFLETSENEFRKEEENKLKLQKRTLRRTRIFALVLGSAAVISLGLFLYTRQLSIIAENNAIEAQKQRAAAEASSLDAQTQTRRAELNLAIADSQRIVADSARTIAEQEKERAELNFEEATTQRGRAEKSSKEATRQRNIALDNEQKAKEQEKIAVDKANEAYQRRMLSIAKSMAVKSTQVPNTNPDLKALLSYQAFLFNEKYDGNKHDVDIYNGLYKSLKTLIGPTYNVYKGHEFAVRSVVFIPGTSRFYSAGSDGKILEWNINDQDKKFQVFTEGKGIIKQIKISNNGQYLVSAIERSGMTLFDLQSGSKKPGILKGGETEINSIAIGPESNFLYATGIKNTIECWNLEKLNYIVIGTSTSTINSLAISPDGAILAGGTLDGRLIIWRTKGEVSSQTVYHDPERSIYSVAYSPDGKWITCGDLKGDIILLKSDNFEQVSVLSGHSARISEIQFSPDSKSLASASYDGTVLFWELADLTNPPIIMDDHSGLVFSVAFSPDGQYLVSSGMDEDRLIKRPANSNLLSEKICSYVSRNFSTSEWGTYVGQDIPYEITCKVRKLEIGIKPDANK